MAKSLWDKEPAVGIEPTTAHIIDEGSPSTLASVLPSVVDGWPRRNSDEAAPERREVPNERPIATGTETRHEAFLLKRHCYRIYRKALRSGRLVPGPCFAANEQCRGIRRNGHHHDYRQPLHVTWACDSHHVQLDRLRRAGHSLASAMVELLLSPAPIPRPSGAEQ